VSNELAPTTINHPAWWRYLPAPDFSPANKSVEICLGTERKKTSAYCFIAASVNQRKYNAFIWLQVTCGKS